MRPLWDRKNGHSLWEVLANNLIDVLSVLVVVAALWQIAHQNGLISTATKQPVEQVAASAKSSWWKTAPAHDAPGYTPTTASEATPNPTKKGGLWGIFVQDDEDEDLQQPVAPEASPKLLQQEQPTHLKVTPSAVPPYPDPIEKLINSPNSHQPPKIKTTEEDPTPQPIQPNVLQNFFTFFEFDATTEPSEAVWEDVAQVDYGIAKFLKSLKQAAQDGSKYAGELLSRWAESEFLATDGQTDDEGKEGSILQRILASQDSGDGEFKAEVDWKKTLEPVTPLLSALNSAAQAGSASAGELLKKFFASLTVNPEETNPGFKEET
ncbi:hypothetical protein HDU67_003768, partial [Dinochytrium kinnereticum]